MLQEDEFQRLGETSVAAQCRYPSLVCRKSRCRLSREPNNTAACNAPPRTKGPPDVRGVSPPVTCSLYARYRTHTCPFFAHCYWRYGAVIGCAGLDDDWGIRYSFTTITSLNSPHKPAFTQSDLTFLPFPPFLNASFFEASGAWIGQQQSARILPLR